MLRYAKEFFITAKGEVIKMAALVTYNPTVRKSLEEQKEARDR